jgi:hypothetical protein
MNDVVATIRSIRELAARADQLARDIEGHRVRGDYRGSAVSIEQPHRTTSITSASGASVMAIAQLGQHCRDFASVYATAFAALPDDLQKQIAAA